MVFLITTSRRPTRRTRSFCKDLERVLPNAVRVNRGKMSLIDVALRALEYNADRIILVSVFKGNPGRIRFFSVSRGSFVEIPPIINILGVKLLREFRDSKMIRASSLVILPIGEEADLLEFSSSLADALKAKVLSSPNINDFSTDTAFLRVEHGRRSLYNLAFVDKFNVPIGPLIRVKSIRFKFRGLLEETRFVEN
ncbi:MAG: hypothetical protein NDF54_02140 [archaeon GB-1867-035]|nr:hypothetical protein [Candidatus Culexmicrobium profundum]